MREFDAAKADELARAYRESLRAAALRARRRSRGCSSCCVSSTRRAARLGIVSAKRHDIVQLALDALGSATRSTSSSAPTRRRAVKPHPDQILLALERLGADPDQTAYVGDAPFDVAAARAAGVHAFGVTWGGIHSRERMEAERPMPSSTRPKSSCRALTTARAAELRELVDRYSYEYHVLDDAVGPRRGVRPALRRAGQARRGTPRADHPGVADAARRRAAVGPVPEGSAPGADGVAGEGHDRRGAASSGQRTCASGSAPTSRSPTCSSRRSTGSPSTSHTSRACSSAAPRAATACRART